MDGSSHLFDSVIISDNSKPIINIFHFSFSIRTQHFFVKTVLEQDYFYSTFFTQYNLN